MIAFLVVCITAFSLTFSCTSIRGFWFTVVDVMDFSLSFPFFVYIFSVGFWMRHSSSPVFSISFGIFCNTTLVIMNSLALQLLLSVLIFYQFWLITLLNITILVVNCFQYLVHVISRFCGLKCYWQESWHYSDSSAFLGDLSFPPV